MTPSRHPRAPKRGVALVIVLAFIVLVTGLIVAFFSRTVIDRQVSNSSAGQQKAAIFAIGAADQIIGDFKQEIVDSSGWSPAITPYLYLYGTTRLYSPNSATAAPYRMTGPGAPPNVVEISLSGSSFYPLVSSSTWTVAGPARASSALTTGTSQNGRYISLARWNKPCLLTGTDASMTPLMTGSAAFTAPNWILVSRSGATPALSGTAVFSGSNAQYLASGTGAIIGRYAYVVYDEGGVLDANVAGYPVGSGSAAVIPNDAYKSALAYADLTQLPGMSGSMVDTLVGWRNYASTSGSGQVTGAFPNPGFTSVSGSNYFNYVISNTTGFLTVSGTYGNQTDKAFGSRQELIQFFKNGLGISGTNLNVLNYFGTFSRDLNQPSFIRTQSISSTTLGYNSTAPSLLLSGSGGNNAAPDLAGAQLDTAINPSFLAVQVSGTSMIRNDGSTALAGEPLVKKRFSLNRLAWLTYAGPISTGSSLNPTSDPGVATIITALENTYGFTDAFLKQGSASNIQQYFGLSWDSANNRWLYNIHNQNGATGPIRKLSYSGDSGKDVVGANREPDFFELLKATINVGSIAKAAYLPPSTPPAGYYPDWVSQYNTDSRGDDATIQIAANITDQFDLDNVPPRIYFDAGSGPVEFRGIENLPYLYRVDPVVLKAVAPNTNNNGQLFTSYGGSVNASNSANTAPATVNTVLDTGLGVTMLLPTLWNPHDWDATNLDRTLGVAGPTSFRIYALSSSSSPITVITSNPTDGSKNNYYGNISTSGTVSPDFITKGFPPAGEQRILTAANTAMTFQISKSAMGAQLFREPTVLYKPQHPSGSQLAWDPAVQNNLGVLASSGTLFSNGGIIFSGMGGSPPEANQSYIGFYLGTVPLVWINAGSSPPATVNRANAVKLSPAGEFGYYLQYENPAGSGNWVTYDEKHAMVSNAAEDWGNIARPMVQTWSGFLQNRCIGDKYSFVMDPRTSRFNFEDSGNPGTGYATGPTNANFFRSVPMSGDPNMTVYNDSWISISEGIMVSLRSGYEPGANLEISTVGGMQPFLKQLGFYPGQPTWTWNNFSEALYTGLFSQNTPFERWSNGPLGDTGSPTYFSMTPSPIDTQPQVYADADGVVRRAMGGWVSTPFADTGSQLEKLGLPMRRAHVIDPATGNQLKKVDVNLTYPPNASLPLQTESRPMILNRPFRSVGELGYTFSGTPWKNLNFEMPESGDSALLDVFCVNDTGDPSGLVAGKVNLNTRQLPVLQAIISGAYRDELALSGTSIVSGSSSTVLSGSLAAAIAAALVNRTTNLATAGKGPLQNIAELVGKWKSPVDIEPINATAPTSGYSVQTPQPTNSPPYGPTSYDGFSADLTSVLLSGTFNSGPPANANGAQNDDSNIGRVRNAPLRALAACGETRIWNLMIDVVAQVGRYPQSATSLDNFVVEGEQRCWIHVAIDRYTGQVVDKQIEVVKE